MSAPAPEEKRVSWAELFVDLVFVFAVTEVSTLLEEDHSAPGLLRAFVVFVPLYWMWVGTAVWTNLHDMSLARSRFTIFVIALTAMFMALALPHAYENLGRLFAVAYWAGRVVLGVGAFAPTRRRGTIPVTPPTVSMIITGPILVAGAFFQPGLREVIWAVAAAIELGTPSILRGRLRNLHVDAAHLTERFGLFVLIALGESVVQIGASAQSGGHLTAGIGYAVAAAFALTCGLWWVYFHFAADAMRHSLATTKIQIDITRLVLSYGHLSLISAIILAAVGMHHAVAHPAERLGWQLAGILFGGLALYLATFGFTRWAMFRLVSVTRLATAGAVLLLLPMAAYVPALASLTAVAIVVALLNVFELLRVEHSGWRARLGHRFDSSPGST
jgi:low temperature requirement protein LtrA